MLAMQYVLLCYALPGIGIELPELAIFQTNCKIFGS